jgi:hypothetical protein
MIPGLAACLLRDFVYEQDQNGDYSVSYGKLKKNDKDNSANIIWKAIDDFYAKLLESSPDRSLCDAISFDPIAFNQAMSRYSRDIFGESRLKAKLDSFKSVGHLTTPEYDEACAFSDYGFKVDSCRHICTARQRPCYTGARY